MPDLWDVIVAGAGTAGMSVAIFAAQRGARVLVVEHSTRLGGSLHLCAGRLSAAGTRLQSMRGIHDTPQLHFEDAMRISRQTADARALRRVIDHSAETLHWLLDVGFKVMPQHPIIHCESEPYSIPRTYFGPDGALGILNALLPPYRSQERAGKIKTLLGAEVIGVVQQPDGAVSSFRVRDESGAMTEVRGRNLVLATGGYASHADRFRRWTGHRPYFPCANSHSRGGGHQIGLDVGGVLKHGEKFLCAFAGVRDPRDSSCCATLTELVPQSRPPWELYVNLEGRRFMREDEPSADARQRALFDQPDMSFWAIYDAGMAASTPAPFVSGLSLEELSPLWNEHPSFKRASSIGDLARACGVDAGALTRSAQVFNMAVADGVDAAFAREYLPRSLGSPPYFAILHHGVSQVGWAGLEVDDQLSVVNGDGWAIPNLYAVGEVLGFGLMNGNAFLGGMGLQPALTLGRMLGQRMLRW